MNYYPYFNGFPYMTTPIASTARTGLLKGLFGNIKWGSILSGTQKTLGIVNQAIPLIKQAGPVLNNAKTMFHVMNEFKKVDTPVETPTPTVENVSSNIKEVSTNSNSSNNGLTFFQ